MKYSRMSHMKYIANKWYTINLTLHEIIKNEYCYIFKSLSECQLLFTHNAIGKSNIEQLLHNDESCTPYMHTTKNTVPTVKCNKVFIL